MIKRLFDVTLSGIGLILSSPLWVLIPLAVKLEDGGPVFFPQDRVGLDGRVFQAMKYRSMVPAAESRSGPVQASEDDPRITRVGRWLRGTAMDELPQLWNIFVGDMSFVGPRPLRPDEVEVRGDGRLVCAFVDVDDLKHVNDRDGHAAGDRVLQALVSIMRTNLRSFDPIVRYGGDEFVCGLGAAEVSDVERRFALINRSLRSAVGAGISVGIAALAGGETLDDVLARADAALLATKQARGA